MVLLAGGAKFLDSWVTSVDAELTGLELATRAVSNVSRGMRNVEPHRIDASFEAQEFLKDHANLFYTP
eukprot:10406057-Karenia_brevis.AAC.1